VGNQTYEGGLVSINKHSTTSTESIDSITPSKEVDTVVKKVSRELKVVSEEDHINQPKVKEGTKELYHELKSRILNLGSDVEVVPRKSYIGYKRRTNFIDVSFLSNHLWCWLNMKKGELEDPNGLCRDVSDWTLWKWTSVYRLDLDYLMFLIKQSYNKQGIEDG
jgi:predicted transport protein